MKPKVPKEDPADKAARLRERRLAELDRTAATQQLASGMTSDVRSVYGTGVSMFGLGKASVIPSVAVPARVVRPAVPTNRSNQ